jgi:Tfp pilus assembly ATPase PilU
VVKAGKISADVALDHADSRNNLSLQLRLEKGAERDGTQGLSITQDDDGSFLPS